VNLQLILSALRARLGVAALVLGVALVVTAVVSLLMPKTYRATASLLVDAKEEQSLNSALRPLIAPQERMAYLQTQVDILTSRKVAREVVRELKLAERATAREAFQEETGGEGSIEDWLVETLLERLKVETSQSSVVHLSFTYRDAAFTAQAANAFAKAYIDAVLELRVEPQRQAAQWFDEQLKNLRANLEDAQARLTDYHRQRGIVSAEERFDIENTRLDEISAQLVRAQDQTFEARSRERQARELVARKGAQDALPQVLADPFIQRLKADVLHGEAKLAEAARRYGPAHPSLQRQQNEQQALRERYDAEVGKVVGSLATATRQSQQREGELRAALQTQRERVLALKESRNELTVLARNVESAQRAYDTAMQRFVVTHVDSRASQANVAILAPAVVPAKPFRPRIALNLVLALVVGAALGIAVVTLLEMADRRVRSRAELAFAGEVPLLAVLGGRRAGASFLPSGAEAAR
jgi:chain length determinant protein EpsF